MRITLVLALIFVSHVVLAQTKGGGTIGIEIGPNASTIRGQDIERDEVNPMMGMLAGMAFSYKFSDRTSIKTGIYYESKGTKLEDQLVDENGTNLGTHELTHKFKYINIPLMLRYEGQKDTKFFINAGPYFAFLFEKTIEASDIPNTGDVKIDDSDRYKSGEFGIAVGIGVSTRLGKNLLLSFEIRDNYGLTNVAFDDHIHSINLNSLNFLPGISYSF